MILEVNEELEDLDVDEKTSYHQDELIKMGKFFGNEDYKAMLPNKQKPNKEDQPYLRRNTERKKANKERQAQQQE